MLRLYRLWPVMVDLLTLPLIVLLLYSDGPTTDHMSSPKEGSDQYKLSSDTTCFVLSWPPPETVSVTKQSFQTENVSGVAHQKHGSIQTLTSTSLAVSRKSKAAA